MNIVFFFLLGIVSGIVINRAADNLPYDRALFAAPHCPHCNTPRKWIQQSGILAYLARRDKCPHCSAPLAARAPVVEIGAAILFAWLANRFPPGLYLAAICFFSAALILLAVIDLEYKLILNVLSLPLTVVAFIAAPLLYGGANAQFDAFPFQAYWISFLGIVTGYALTLAIYYLGVLFLRMVNRGRAHKINTVAFGMGDVKLAGLLGALVGFPAIIYVLVYAILLGGVGALGFIVWRMVTRKSYSAFMAIPYGPYLILAGGAFLILGADYVRRVVGL